MKFDEAWAVGTSAMDQDVARFRAQWGDAPCDAATAERLLEELATFACSVHKNVLADEACTPPTTLLLLTFAFVQMVASALHLDDDLVHRARESLRDVVQHITERDDHT